jgi:23S rRNA pseudouridine1911/1915/1917 synthase
MNPLDKEKILYCDNHLLIVNKEAGVVTQPDLTERAKGWVKNAYKKPREVFLEPIHRLDRPVSGLVLFARTSKALSRLQLMMREKRIQKKYHALVEKFPYQPGGRLVHYLKHALFRAQIVPSSDPDAKEAVLDYRVLERRKKGVLLEIDLITGRYHQIRIQLATIGCSIIGDVAYGSNQSWPVGIALCSVYLGFEHPVTHQKIEIFQPGI